MKASQSHHESRHNTLALAISQHHSLQPWRWRQHYHPKHKYPVTALYGVISQKTQIWIDNILLQRRKNECFTWIFAQCQVKVSLCFLTKHHAMKAYWGEWMYSSTHSLTSALDGAPGTHWIGGWVGPRAVLDAVVKRKIPSTRRESNPDRPACSQALYRLSYHGSPS
jgi:hypothetical protein